ncbi:MAG: hypothetical protein J7L15_01940 [Clostridiales bacterium]|nr:hypothetical protein [Clostridiales bacterium]
MTPSEPSEDYNFLFEYIENNKKRFSTFKDYIVSEAFKPKKVDLTFGENYDGWYALFDDLQTKKEYAVVLFKRGEIAFTNTDNLDVEYGDDIATKSGAPFSVISSVFYAAIQLTKNQNFQMVYFSGYSPALKSLYYKMSKNKSFIKEVNKLGFSVHIEKDNIVLRII